MLSTRRYGLLSGPAGQRTYGLSGVFVVMNQLLAESGMRHHPVNPMTTAIFPVWLKRNPQGAAASFGTCFRTRCGCRSSRAGSLTAEGYRYAVLDALTEHHLEIQEKPCAMPHW